MSVTAWVLLVAGICARKSGMPGQARHDGLGGALGG